MVWFKFDKTEQTDLSAITTIVALSPTCPHSHGGFVITVCTVELIPKLQRNKRKELVEKSA